jgi:hypothetical protein
MVMVHSLQQGPQKLITEEACVPMCERNCGYAGEWTQSVVVADIALLAKAEMKIAEAAVELRVKEVPDSILQHVDAMDDEVVVGVFALKILTHLYSNQFHCYYCHCYGFHVQRLAVVNATGLSAGCCWWHIVVGGRRALVSHRTLKHNQPRPGQEWIVWSFPTVLVSMRARPSKHPVVHKNKTPNHSTDPTQLFLVENSHVIFNQGFRLSLQRFHRNNIR